MRHYKFTNLAKIVKNFKNKKVLVIGDLLLDQYIWGDVSRISPEAPVPVVWVKKEELLPGGACNVASNLSKLGAHVSLVGMVGEDKNAQDLMQELKKRNISTEGIVFDPDRKTSLKTRVIAHQQQVVRIDREDIDHIKDGYFDTIKNFLKENFSKYDGVIIEDYGKGVITPQLIKLVVKLAQKYNKFVSVDPKENNFSYYKNVSVITPNHHEASRAVGFPVVDQSSRESAGLKLLKANKAEAILLTLGEEGMMVFQKDKKSAKIPTLAQEVFDVSGAGDTVISVYTLSVLSGGSPLVAAHIANCAAGIVVGKVGAASIGVDELLTGLKRETS